MLLDFVVIAVGFCLGLLPLWWMSRRRPDFPAFISWMYVLMWSPFVAVPISSPNPPLWAYLFPIVMNPIGMLLVVLRWQIINPAPPMNNEEK